jgi:hypothetical protein
MAITPCSDSQGYEQEQRAAMTYVTRQILLTGVTKVIAVHEGRAANITNRLLSGVELGVTGPPLKGESNVHASTPLWWSQ